MTSWFILSIGAVLCLSTFLLLTKKLLNTNYDPFVYGGLMQLTTGILGLIVLPFTGFSFTFSLQNYFYLLLVGITYTIAASLYYWSMQHIDLSEFTILESSTMIWGILLGLIVFTEAITPMKIISVLLIFFALYIVSTHHGLKVTLDKYRILALVSTIFYTLGAALDKHLTGQSNPSSYLVLSFLTAGVTMLLFHRKRISSTFNFPKQILVNSSFVMIAYTMLFRAYELNGELSKITIILQTQIIIVTLAGIFLLKEKTNIPRKLFSALLAFAGLWVVNI